MIPQAWKHYKHMTDHYKVVDKFGTSFDGERMWADIEEQFGGYPDGKGAILFDTEEGELLFILKYTSNDNVL
jgi:hypothetical protein